MQTTKQIDEYTLKYNPNHSRIEISTLNRLHLGVVYLDRNAVCCESKSWACLRVTVVNAAAEFLTECLEAEKREKLCTFKCEVEFKFELDEYRVRVRIDGINVGCVKRDGYATRGIPATVVTAARKFAGWSAQEDK